ncbi:RHS repeat-associated core domain-containing protein [Lentisphaerota bacterium WC36G]|nr:RHS repeat-associated core domain-containing protein [Lentisphaerae bacterium WC36]
MGAVDLFCEDEFVYDGFKLIAEFDMLNSDEVSRQYAWSNTDLDTPMWMKSDSEYYYYMVDGNKNVTKLVDETGALANNYEYSPFGKLINEVESIEQPFKFSSEYADSETGLIYYNYRYYNPENGKWLKRDPIAEQGGLNLYGFVNNDSISNIDLLGLKPPSIKSKMWVSMPTMKRYLSLSQKILWYGFNYPIPIGGSRRPGLKLFDYFNEMDEDLQDEMIDFQKGLIMLTYLIGDDDLKEGEWTTKNFNIIGILPIIKLYNSTYTNIIFQKMTLSFWLSGAHRVDGEGTFEYRKCGKERELKSFQGNFIWWDEIDANSYETAIEKGNWYSGSLEGSYDFLFENDIINAAFDVKIQFDYKDEHKDKPLSLSEDYINEIYKNKKNEYL